NHHIRDPRAFKPLVKLTQEGDLASLQSCIHSLGQGSVPAVINKHFGRSGDTLMHYLGVHVEVYNNDYKRPLHEAASMERLDCVKYLLHEGAKVDSLKKADWTPLMMACTRRTLSVIQELLLHGADVTLKNKDGWSAFHIACREGSAAVVLLLLQHSETAWATESKTGRTPLHTAGTRLHTAGTRCEYRPDQADSCGVTPFMDAVRNGHISVARRLLEKHKVKLLSVSDGGGQTGGAARAPGGSNGAERRPGVLVKELRVDVNERATDLQLTALLYAAKEGHSSTIRTLEELGADLHVQDAKGRTALHMASIGQHAEAVSVLLELGLKNCPDSSGTTPQQLRTVTDHMIQSHSNM
uniref:Ankyrin repeat domain 16 n=1 Tax=Neogobius melanostomus TaxID=47308 RepID=A0A8C6TDW0_9GOBI